MRKVWIEAALNGRFTGRIAAGAGAIRLNRGAI
jgi:hypothetical protein